ncbi:MAG: NAD-dependent epimerase/dehydratase family protein [Anaerolineales bacterium]
MTTALVTGAYGFVGRNLCTALARQPEVALDRFGTQNTSDDLDRFLDRADIIFHLAGVNRPADEHEFQKVNVGLTEDICERLRRLGRRPRIVLASSTQAALDNPYGLSKRLAEDVLHAFAADTGASVVIYRLRNLFGKWSRPNYNSVVATFCHNIARDLPITISDPSRQLELTYIDDVVAAFLSELTLERNRDARYAEVERFYRVTLGELASMIRSFRAVRNTLVLPSLGNQLTRALYATYLSFLPRNAFAYPLDSHADQRGALAELLKSLPFGQIFVSRTHPGVTRGNHYHDTKTEKFVVLEGEALIRFRHILEAEVIEYPVSGAEFRVVDIPPGYTHSIANVGDSELVTLFWASELFDSAHPDTYYLAV